MIEKKCDKKMTKRKLLNRNQSEHQQNYLENTSSEKVRCAKRKSWNHNQLLNCSYSDEIHNKDLKIASGPDSPNRDAHSASTCLPFCELVLVIVKHLLLVIVTVEQLLL